MADTQLTHYIEDKVITAEIHADFQSFKCTCGETIYNHGKPAVSCPTCNRVYHRYADTYRCAGFKCMLCGKISDTVYPVAQLGALLGTPQKRTMNVCYRCIEELLDTAIVNKEYMNDMISDLKKIITVEKI